MQVHGDFVEVNGSLWKLMETSGSKYRKLENSIASIETSTTSMEAPVTAVEASIHFYEKNNSTEISESQKKVQGLSGSRWNTLQLLLEVVSTVDVTESR